MAAQQGQHGQQERTGRQPFYTGSTAYIVEQGLRFYGSAVQCGGRLSSLHPGFIRPTPLLGKPGNLCRPEIQHRDMGQVARQTRLTIAHNTAGDGKAIAACGPLLDEGAGLLRDELPPGGVKHLIQTIQEYDGPTLLQGPLKQGCHTRQAMPLVVVER